MHSFHFFLPLHQTEFSFDVVTHGVCVCYFIIQATIKLFNAFLSGIFSV